MDPLRDSLFDDLLPASPEGSGREHDQIAGARTAASLPMSLEPQSTGSEFPELLGLIVEATASVAEPGNSAQTLRRTKADEIDQYLFEQIAQNRSEAAFSQFYDRYSARVYALLLHVVRVEEDAQDLLQEVFVIAWRKAPEFLSHSGNVSAWILTLARNRAVDELRSRKYRNRKLEQTILLGEDRPELDKLVELERVPDAMLAAKEAQREIRRALKSLTEEQRKVLDLAYFGGLTHTEISEQLHMPMGTVKSKLRQAIVRLGRILKPRM